MSVTTTSLTAKGIGISGNDDGVKMWAVDSVTKPLTNDRIKIVNASTVITAILVTDSAGAVEPCTISSNIITLTSANEADHVSGVIVYK